MSSSAVGTATSGNIGPSLERLTKLWGMVLPREAMAVFGAWCLDEEAIRRWLVDRLHPRGFKCPKCGSPARQDQHSRLFLLRPVVCQCGRTYTALSGTILAGARLDLRQVYLLMVLLELGLTPQRIGNILGVSDETIRQWRNKFAALEEAAR